MSTSEPALVRACPEADVEERRLTYIDVGGKCFLVTRWEGELKAYRNLCKHQYLVMEDCEVDEDSMRCPYHTVRYFLGNGDVKDDSGFMGVESLTSYPVRVIDGWVHLEVPANEKW